MNRNKFVFTDEMLNNTPSRKDGCPADLELDLRTTGCEQIQAAGGMLKIPQVATSTAQVLFQRFFYLQSFLKFNLLNVAMACIFLASEASENERLTTEIINAFYHLRQEKKPASQYTQVENEPTAEGLAELESIIHDNESHVLSKLGFCTDVSLPHQLLFDYLKKLNLAKHRKVLHLAWSYLNDTFRTNAAVRFKPETLACACIKLAAHFLKVPLPETPPWWAPFGANFLDMMASNVELMKLRDRPKHSLKDLSRRLAEVKERNRKMSESEAKILLPSQPSACISVINSSFTNAIRYSPPKMTNDDTSMIPKEVPGDQALKEPSTSVTHDPSDSLKSFPVPCGHVRVVVPKLKTSLFTACGETKRMYHDVTTKTTTTDKPTQERCLSHQCSQTSKNIHVTSGQAHCSLPMKSFSIKCNRSSVSITNFNALNSTLLGCRGATPSPSHAENLPLPKCSKRTESQALSNGGKIHLAHLGKRKCSIQLSHIIPPPQTKRMKME